MRYAAIKYKYDVVCKKCKAELAYRGQCSHVFDERGEPVTISSGGEDASEERYRIVCKCDEALVLRSPRDAQQWSTFDDYRCGGPPATLLI